MPNFYCIFEGEFVFNPKIAIPSIRLNLLTVLSICLEQDEDCIPKIIDVYSSKEKALMKLEEYQSFLNVRPGYCNGLEYHINLVWMSAIPCPLLNSTISSEFTSVAKIPFSNIADHLFLDYKIDIDLRNHILSGNNISEVIDDLQEIIPFISFYCEYYDLDIKIVIKSKNSNANVILDYANSFTMKDSDLISDQTSDYIVSIVANESTLCPSNIHRLDELCQTLMIYMYGNGTGSIKICYQDYLVSEYLLKPNACIYDRIMPNLQELYVNLNEDHNIFIQP